MIEIGPSHFTDDYYAKAFVEIGGHVYMSESINGSVGELAEWVKNPSTEQH